jgi:hypothetical protein
MEAWEARSNERAQEVRAKAIGQLLDQGVLLIKEEPRPVAMGEFTKDVAEQAISYMRNACDERLADIAREVDADQPQQDTRPRPCANCGNMGKIWLDTAQARVPLKDCHCVEHKQST